MHRLTMKITRVTKKCAICRRDGELVIDRYDDLHGKPGEIGSLVRDGDGAPWRFRPSRIIIFGLSRDEMEKILSLMNP